jgi:hypothetical protein
VRLRATGFQSLKSNLQDFLAARLPPTLRHSLKDTATTAKAKRLNPSSKLKLKKPKKLLFLKKNGHCGFVVGFQFFFKGCSRFAFGKW